MRTERLSQFLVFLSLPVKFDPSVSFHSDVAQIKINKYQTQAGCKPHVFLHLLLSFISVRPSATWSVRLLWAGSVQTSGRGWLSSTRWGRSAAWRDRRWVPSSRRLPLTSGPPAAGPASDAAAPPSGQRWPPPPPPRPGSPGVAAPGSGRGNSAPCKSSWVGRHAAAGRPLEDGWERRKENFRSNLKAWDDL